VSAVGTGQTGHSSRQDTPPTAAVRHLARHQVMGLASVFLLGMAVNLIGLPSQTSGVAHLASVAFLAAHALIALGLVIGTVLLLRAAARLGGRWRGQATAGAAAIAVAVAAGILTVITSSNWWSYAMAAGFIAALLAYGSLLLLPAPTTSPARSERGGTVPQTD
jgi:hypothetical protein